MLLPGIVSVKDINLYAQIQNKVHMAAKKAGLPEATVARLAHLKDGVRVENAAVKLAAAEAEALIKDMFTGAYRFTENRGGSMIMKKDIEAYLASIR